MKNLKKMVALVCALLMVTVMFAGCGSSNEPAAPSGDPVTITFGIHVANPAEQEAVTNSIVEAFNEKYDGQYTVEFVAADTETHSKNMKLAAEDGTLPDIFWINSAEAPEYAANGFLMDLTDYLANSADIDEALNGMENAFNDGTIQYGLPYQCNVQGFFYNKALFDKAGVAYPTDETTYDDFIGMIGDLNKADVTPISIGSKNSLFAMWPFNEFLARYGWEGMYEGIAAGDDKYNNAELTKCFEKIQGMTDAKAFNSTVSTSEYFDAKQAFLDGETAMFGTGQWDCAAFDEAIGENVGFWWGPVFEDTDAAQDVAMKVPSAPIVVSAAVADDADKNAAVSAFLDFYYGLDAANISYAGSVFPATSYSDVSATDTQYAINAMIEVLSSGWTSPAAAPDQTLNPATQEALYDAIFGIIQGNYDPAKALDKIDAAAAN